MGDDYDIEHELEAIRGPHYGQIALFMRKPVGRRRGA
jgi:hypothetical protein